MLLLDVEREQLDVASHEVLPAEAALQVALGRRRRRRRRRQRRHVAVEKDRPHDEVLVRAGRNG